MKPSLFLKISITALTCLFTLQGTWLYYAYEREKVKIEEILNKSLLETIEKEMDNRYILLENLNKKGISNRNIDTSNEFIFEYDYDNMTDIGATSQQYNFMQQVLVFENMPFNLTLADSIFSSFLQENRLPFKYQIIYTDSLNRIIETTDKSVKKGFQTNIIPIVNGTKAQVIVKITPPTIFRNMLAILAVSILILFFIIACLIYETRIFLTQQHLNQMRENFTHALTHDMKTPLGTIHTILDQLDKGLLDDQPEMRSKFNAIGMEQTLNLQAIVNRILTIAYIEKKQLTLNIQAVNLPKMVQSLIDKFTIKGGKMMKFLSKFDLKEAVVCADSFYLNNAISNLIDNAIKYSGDSVKIEIECTAGDKQIHIRVRDNGFGISPKDQQKIFKRFERGAEIKRKQVSGFGLGLNYVQKVIEAHGGAVAVLSQEGVGSEFIITIPILFDSIKDEII
jgi:two-component system phosphate regulon sensor histidine kinase PhoR